MRKIIEKQRYRISIRYIPLRNWNKIGLCCCSVISFERGSMSFDHLLDRSWLQPGSVADFWPVKLLSSLLKTSRRLTRKIEATVKKRRRKGGPRGSRRTRFTTLTSSSLVVFAIVGHHLSFFFLSLSFSLSFFISLRPTFSTGNQARIRYRRISPINLLLFSSLLFLRFFYSLSRIRSDSWLLSYLASSQIFSFPSRWMQR